MNCENPYIHGNSVHGCGRCLPCRINRRRIWKHRIILESLLHGSSSFLTLTYSDDSIPTTARGIQTLEPRHLRDWLKRFRKAIEPSRIRYYSVGEYGDDTWRPHYHAVLFGYPRCGFGQTLYRPRREGAPYCCDHCRLIHKTWGLGRIDLIELSDHTAGYVAGYVEKKLTRTDDPRLNGRWPEFARMSLRPGIGRGILPAVAQSLIDFNLDQTQADVPGSLRHGRLELPLGRYLKSNLRKIVNGQEKTPDAVLEQIFKEKVLPLLEAARRDSSAPSLKQQVLKASQGSRLRIIGRSKLYKQKRTI